MAGIAMTINIPVIEPNAAHTTIAANPVTKRNRAKKSAIYILFVPYSNFYFTAAF